MRWAIEKKRMLVLNVSKRRVKVRVPNEKTNHYIYPVSFNIIYF